MPRGNRRSAAGRRGRPSSISLIPTAELQRELHRRRGLMDELVKQRDALSAELQTLETVFGDVVSGGVRQRAVLGRPGKGRRGRPPGSGRGRTGVRGQNSTNLVDALRGVLAGSTMSVVDVAEAVQKAGYKTNSGNFRVIVNQALLANPKVFKKVARGQYTAR